MLKVNNITFPSCEQWMTAIKGMRLPMKSLDKMDSFIANDGYCNDVTDEDCKLCPYHGDIEKDGYNCWGTSNEPQVFVLGEKDKKLLLNLCKQGDPSHRKVLRQLPLQIEISAPLYWWKQMDQYRIGTTTNSESTMHTLTKKPFDFTDFSVENIDNLNGEDFNWGDVIPKTHFRTTVLLINQLMQKYKDTNNKAYWYAINEILPQGYIQTRVWSGSYENFVNIAKQRAGHKLPEWDTLINEVLKSGPYLEEILEACK